MTEEEWMACAEVDGLVCWLFFDELASDRKLRLFSVACSRPVLVHLGQFTPSATRVHSLTEAFADRLVTLNELQQAHEALFSEWTQWRRYEFDDGSDEHLALWAVSEFGLNAVASGGWYADEPNYLNSQYRRRNFYHYGFTRSFPATAAAASVAALRDAALLGIGAKAKLDGYQRRLLHDIFGNPFRPVTLDPAWRTSTAFALASGMYESRDFGAMPILADALQDAGCDNEDILDHCRNPDVHVRGCWVVDLVLGKE